MSLVSCKECKKEISDQANSCPSCGAPNSIAEIPTGQKNRSNWPGFIVSIFIVFALFLIVRKCSSKKSEEIGIDTNGKSVAVSKTGELFALPSDQQKFIHIITDATASYEKVDNDLKKSSIRTSRKNALTNLFSGNFSIKNWIGIVHSMGTNGGKDAYITLRINGTNIKIKTWNNSMSDIGDKTLIKHESKLYNIISELKEGDQVVFSGEFIPDGDDYISESSMTEEGSVCDPDFVFRFTELMMAK